MQKIKWRIPPHLEENIKLAEAKFIFNEVNKRLDDTTKTSELILGRLISVLTLTTGSLLTLTAYVINKSERIIYDNKVFVATFAMFYFYYFVASFFKLIFPIKYKVTGLMPKDILTDDWYKVKRDEDQTELFLYLTQIEDYQDRVEENWNTNQKRWLIYKLLLKQLIKMPIILLILYVLLEVATALF